MSDSILQSFLNNQFINTDDLEHIKNLKKASSEVQKKLKIKKNKQLIISYTLVALDPNIPDCNEVVKDVKEIIIKKWSTFLNSVSKVKDSPLSYIQAVILDALDNLSKNEVYAGIIWHTGCNIISFYKITGQKEILSGFLLNIGNKVETAAQASWSIPENTQIEYIEPIKINIPEIRQGIVSKEKTQVHLMAAAAQLNIGGENPQYPSNNTAIWPTFFSERAAEGLTTEINAALYSPKSSLESVSSSIEGSIRTYFDKLQPYFEQVSSSILKSSESLNKRSNLLWWKQSLYSKSLDKSYRSLEPLTLAVTMSTDLANMVQPIYPKSVDYLLQETLRDVLGENVTDKNEISEFIDKLGQLSEDESQLLESMQVEATDRMSIGSSIVGIINKTIDNEEFFEQTGIDKKARLSIQELTVWLFHDLQATELLRYI